MSLRPPSTSPSPSPGPNENGRNAARQSLGATRGPPGLAPSSPRPGARPTSELLGPSTGMFQTPEAEALDQWFENLQNYEATLEEMAAASLDVNFKEELSAIEQWFKVLSEAERTAALYSLLQHSTQVQIRFFITVLQQMARSDPMTALLSPAMGGSMQSQMDAKLASLKSPGLKSGLPASPTARNFNAGPASANRQSLVLDSTAGYLSPDSATLPSASKEDAAATLAQQRAKLRGGNAANRISAPVLSSGADGRGAWGSAGTSLSQVAEQNGPAQEVTVGRPKSTEFSGSPRPAPAPEQTVNAPENSWASMVNTPLIPMFHKENRPSSLDAASNKLNDWKSANVVPGVPRMGDPTIHRRRSNNPSNDGQNGGSAGGVYDDNGNLINGGQQQQQQFGNNQARFRNMNSNNNNWGGGSRSPALSNTSDNNMPNLNGLGMPMGGFGMGQMGSPGGMGMMPGLGGMNPFGVNMNMLSAMGLSPEAQLLAAQMAASGFVGQPGWMGMAPQNSAGLVGRGRNGPLSGRSPGIKSAGSVNSSHGLSTGGGGGTPRAEEDVDPSVLHDIPAWLRSLRLHKYTPNFENMRWQDMVMMDEAALEAQGVAALGARRKMMKTFELVRKKMGIEGGPPSLPPSATLRSP
ncbi:hypothetical protein C8J56DRAFT_6692 [Mycena floridula]|nr:hypothetical protein C8J56DRAFT_6692 [Mycena floridula]